MARAGCPLCRATLAPGDTHCPRCDARVAPLERPPRHRGGGGSGRRLPAAPESQAQAVRLGAAGGAALVGVALVAAALARLAGGDAVAALGNASLLLGMTTLGIAALLGGVRVSRWSGGEERLRRRARGEAGTPRGRLRLSLAVAGALPFALFLVLAATH